VNTVDELNAWLTEHNLAGLWTGTAGSDQLTPHLWKWSDIHHGVMAATELVPIDSGGRRTVNVRHPQFPDRMSNTVHMSVQCVLPGEVATAHRHNPAAIRFVIQGSPQAFTVVEGEPMPMETGDVITTPNWTWHDHHNESDAPVIWLDGLDVRFVGIWRTLWQEFGDERRQPVTRPVGYSQRTLGRARPSWLKSEHPTPPMRYPWTQTYETLQALKSGEAEGDPYDGIQLTFTHPLTGGATFPTFACELQLLTPHLKTKMHRHLSTAIYHVHRGTGATIVDGQRLAWSPGDIFLIPPWSAHYHENLGSEDAILFSIDDWPSTTSLGLYREEEVSN
jgi:1-hydroxy-2-naphthoate dioxygenase